MDGETFTTRKAILTIFLGIALLIFAQGISSIVYDFHLPEGIESVAAGVCYVIIAYGLIKFCCDKVLHISMKECHIGKPEIHVRWLICAVLLPAGVSAVLFCTSGKLVKNNMDTIRLVNIVLSAVFIDGLGPGVVEEMVFRGLIMRTMEKRWGTLVAIIVPSMIFGLIHALGRNMSIADLVLLFAAGTSVGIMFSLIVYESGSIWASAVVHGIWNVVMIGGILNIGAEYKGSAIFSYKLLSKSSILTGGAFGVEASIVAVIGYILVIFYALFLMQRKAKNLRGKD